MPLYAEQLSMMSAEVLEDNEGYRQFVEKFKPKKTTDDCFTPDEVYDAVASWVEKEYGLRRENFVRPFYPGGDYMRENYPAGCVVVDNPPFSILTQIVDFYGAMGIRYFLFKPGLTMIKKRNCCQICTDSDIEYENGARVRSGFVTNLEENILRTAPELGRAICEAQERRKKETKKENPKYSYPMNVVTLAMMNKLSKYGQDFRIRKEEARFIGELDAQKASGKGIFGGGYLIGGKAAAEKAAAEKAAAEKAAAEKAAAEKTAAHVWELSEREKEIIREIDQKR